MRVAIKMMSSMATRQLLSRLVDNYAEMCVDNEDGRRQPAQQGEQGGRSGDSGDSGSRDSANPSITLESAGGVNVVKRIEGGETADWIVLSSDAIAGLAEKGLIDPASKVDLFESSIAVAVPAGAAAIDISSEAALKAAVLDAAHIGYSTGPSGTHLLRVFARWGIADEIADKLVQSPAGVPVGAMLQQGRVTLGFQQLSELQDIDGIRIIGPLPPAVALVTVFSIAMAASSNQAEAFAKWINFVGSPQQDKAIRACGMVPLQRPSA